MLDYVHVIKFLLLLIIISYYYLCSCGSPNGLNCYGGAVVVVCEPYRIEASEKTVHVSVILMLSVRWSTLALMCCSCSWWFVSTWDVISCVMPVIRRLFIVDMILLVDCLVWTRLPFTMSCTSASYNVDTEAYAVSQEKHATLFSTITVAFPESDFLYFLYHWKQERILV